MHFSFFIIVSLFLILNTSGQDNNDTISTKKFFVNGYIKDLRTIAFIDGLDNIVLDNLLHHRLNTEYEFSRKLQLNVEFRNRIFYGETVRNTLFYSQLIDVHNDYFDLSYIPVDRKSLFIHLMADRAYLTYTLNKFEIRAGRQRINWGINTVWNPNDLFNAYSFFDFDYEERPGSDAVRIVYYKNISSGFELAARAADHIDSTTIALLSKFNTNKYDFQILTGVDKGDLALGGGWAGNIKGAGFKGEFTYFHSYRNFKSASGSFITSVSGDYSFKNGIYSTAGVLFNSAGSTKTSADTFIDYQVSAKNLSPFKLNMFAQAAYPVTPVFYTSFAVMFAPATDVYFFNPALSLSLATNWDLDVLSQVFMAKTSEEGFRINPVIFTRLKWSY